MAVSREFVLAGNAIFTVACPDEKHYTYRVSKVPGSPQWPNDAWFVKLLTGPDNTSDYSYLGRLNADRGEVTLTSKSKMTADALPVRLLNRILARVWEGNHKAYEDHGYRTHHEGRCGRCGRVLTVPESIESGIGPECARKMGCERKPKGKRPAKEHAELPFYPANSEFKSPIETEVFELSERPGYDLSGFTAETDAEGDVLRWVGKRNGVLVTVFND